MTATHRDLIARFSRDARVSNALATLLNVVPIAEAAMPMTRYVTEGSTLVPRHRTLLMLRTAWLCQSHALWAAHATEAHTSGTGADEIGAIAQGAAGTGWDDLERLLLLAADELVLTSAVTDATWSTLASGHLVEWLMDVVETVAHSTFLALVYNSFGVQPDADASEQLPADVPHTYDGPEREPPLSVARIDPGPGDSIAVLRTFARHPDMAQARRPRSVYINQISPLSPHDRETLILRIGWDCRSEYEWAKHVGSVGRARDHGVDPVAVAGGPDAPGVSRHDAVLMRVADELHQNATVSNETWDWLTDAYDLAGAMSAIFTAASYRSTSMSLNAYGVQLEPGDEQFPPGR
jgi:4-carboxymuconolactone decarboxylase